MKPLLVLGIMSGTSIDGVDYALCRVSDNRVRLEKYWQTKFPGALRQRLHRAAQGLCSARELAQLHHDLGRFYSRQAARAGVRPRLVGLHGQTVFHHPDRKNPATLQIGEPAWLVETLRVPVVSNFRAADLAAGGEGAPLATLFHKIVFGRRGAHVCVNNLGGISNVSSLDWTRGAAPRVLAFDTGPANMLLDLAMRELTDGVQHFDRNGAWAGRGHATGKLLQRWLRHEYFCRPPPKSTGRELFGELFFRQAFREMKKAGLSKFDVLATLTEFTARSLALNCRLHLPSAPQVVVLTGGGAKNPVLVRRIHAALNEFCPGVRVRRSEELGWPGQSIEPAAFALLAYYRFHGLAGNLPPTTGAGRAALLGQISEP